MGVKRKTPTGEDASLTMSLESEIKQYLLNYLDGIRHGNIKVTLKGIKKTYFSYIYEFSVGCDEKLLNVIAKQNKFEKHGILSKEYSKAKYLYDLFKNCANISFVKPLFCSKNTLFYKKAEGVPFDKLMEKRRKHHTFANIIGMMANALLIYHKGVGMKIGPLKNIKSESNFIFGYQKYATMNHDLYDSIRFTGFNKKNALLLQEHLRYLYNTIKDRVVPLTTVYVDFKPWNILVKNEENEIVLLDPPHEEIHESIYFDIASFSTGLLVIALRPKNILFSSFRDIQTIENIFIHNYFSESMMFDRSILEFYKITSLISSLSELINSVGRIKSKILRSYFHILFNMIHIERYFYELH